ncbi:MAG TPA: class I tRNA ligase family protein, partial [bacterium]
ALYDFVWGEFCDWYIELVKPRLYDKENPDPRRAAQAVVLHVLDAALRLLHPIMPFITEEIWQALPLPDAARKRIRDGAPSIMIQDYPPVMKKSADEEAEKDMAFLQKVVSAVRNVRSEMNVPPDRKAKLVLRGPEKKVAFLVEQSIHFAKLAGVDVMEALGKSSKPKESATALAEDVELFVPLEGLIDVKKEKERIQKEIDRLEGLLAGVSAKLMQHDFVQKAPKDVVEKERKKQADFEEKVEKLKAGLKALK